MKIAIKTKIPYNSVNTAFFEKISLFRDHLHFIPKIDFYMKIAIKIKIPYNSVNTVFFEKISLFRDHLCFIPKIDFFYENLSQN